MGTCVLGHACPVETSSSTSESRSNTGHALCYSSKKQPAQQKQKRAVLSCSVCACSYNHPCQLLQPMTGIGRATLLMLAV